RAITLERALGPSAPDTEVIRGGPNPVTLKISVETRKTLEKSEDALEAGEKPGDRPSRKLDIPADKLDDTWSKMRDRAEEIGKAEIDYRPDTDPTNLDQTSNSVVRAALDKAGVPLEKALPEGVDPDKFPGINDNLVEKLKRAQQNPIEGEIGGTDDPKPTPDPPSSDNGPTGQDDDSDGDSPPGNSPSDSSSGEGRPQNANFTDPEAPSHTMEIKPGQKATPETMEIKPEQKKLLDDITKSDRPLDNILGKDPVDWTEGEFLEVRKEMVNLPAGPERERLDAMTTDFLEDKYGTGPAEYDAVGRMKEPKPIRPINQKPTPAKTPDGESLAGAMKRIGKAVAGAAGGDGNVTAVQGLQTGLNLLKKVMLKNTGKRLADAPDLKTDGVVGPKTRQALRIATSNFGRPKIEEGFALGRFGRFAQDVQTGRDDPRNLSKMVDTSFGPLLRPQGMALPKQGKPENRALQATLNDLGPRVFEPDGFKPILEDGLIGPKTEAAFRAILPAAGPEILTSRLGHNMGFFDFDDFG
ncbi:MAG: hypothetical protein O3A85_13780, partial [Proteobacteria bacterium]|nr:hypothetical protein [Pseudomonadota bacterium]